jgi:glycine cleavage system aminomethyltransferase T
VGYLTSVVRSPVSAQVIALGYVRKEHKEAGTVLDLPGGQAKILS